MVRAFDQLEPAALTGIVNARAPFLSPDGRWIGFFDKLDEGLNTGPVVQRGALRKVSTSGGPLIVISSLTGVSRGCDPQQFGSDWISLVRFRQLPRGARGYRRLFVQDR
jgi:hypothetical protein